MENFSASNLLKLIPLLIVIVLVIPKGNVSATKKVVRVQNDLGEVTLMVHCRSKDDDVGVHYLSNGNYTTWPFGDSLIRTIFWCTIKWNGEKEDFTVYDSLRDRVRCWLKCWWSVRPDGAYSFNEKTQKYEKLYAW
ncbi:hypothetical protein ACJRO7_014983 [Eucalyptus globulus]|uniref:S-protein homolog n=1 Tax=Eucalyptus globulus TaxID=34317 RepID=A0ABD3L222_EUCGL